MLPRQMASHAREKVRRRKSLLRAQGVAWFLYKLSLGIFDWSSFAFCRLNMNDRDRSSLIILTSARPLALCVETLRTCTIDSRRL